MEYFRNEKITEHITRIHDLTKNMIYLVTGEKRALVLDTGGGVGKLGEYIETLTALPYDVCLTHGHGDHSGGAGWFESVYLHEEDGKTAADHSVPWMKRAYTERVLGEHAKDVPEEMYAPGYDKPYLDIKDGDVFDLGGVTVEMLGLKGHTLGMLCPLIKEDRTILFGDACNHFTFLFTDTSCSIEQYRKNLKAIKKREQEWDRILLSHGKGEIAKSVLDDNIELCGIILEGKADNVPHEFFGKVQYFAKRVGAHFMREDGKLGNIIYNPDNVR